MAWDWLFFLLKFALAFIPLALIPVMIFLERKGAAMIQDRPGPNRAAITLPLLGRIRGFGMVHNFSDAIKLFFKEDFIPRQAQTWFYVLAPGIPVLTAVLTPALIPWFADVPASIAGTDISGNILANSSGLLLLFALGSLGVYGVVLGSWASNSKYSLLGGLRSSAMMISYEISMGLSVLGLIILTGTFDLQKIVEWQMNHLWGVLVQPVGFLLFLVAMFAETNRNPFDVAESEEIVGGFHTEYSSVKFALFFMGEYAHIIVASALLTTLFMGGWHLPWLTPDTIRAHAGMVAAGLLVLKGFALLILAAMVVRQRRRYARLKASDAAVRGKEYGLFTVLFGAGALASFAAAAVLWWLDDSGWFRANPGWAALATVLIQIGIVLAKTLCFCWLFVWVRWTLPRLRYDQIMGLGWKVLLNIALVNLLATAVIAKLLGVGKG